MTLPALPRPLARLAAIILLIAAAALVIDAGLPQRSDYTRVGQIGALPVAPEIGALAPPFTAESNDGTFTLMPGQPTILNFWATWCVPCEIEMPELQAFQTAHPAIRVIAVNAGETPDTALAWAAARDLRLRIAFDPANTITRRYAARGLPTTFVIASDGIIQHIFYGATTRAALEAHFDK